MNKNRTVRQAHKALARKRKVAKKRKPPKRNLLGAQEKRYPSKGHRQGKYIPKHPEKYVGDPTKIRYMSSWELSFDEFLDNNPNILRWSSEEIAIPYVKPTTGRVHKYYPDYWIEYKDRTGKLIHEIIEVKPEKQTKQPTTKGKNRKTQIYESITWAVNTAKWEACQQFCNKYGIKFRLVTEKQLFR